MERMSLTFNDLFQDSELGVCTVARTRCVYLALQSAQPFYFIFFLILLFVSPCAQYPLLALRESIPAGWFEESLEPGPAGVWAHADSDPVPT
jgi:hypothetical protein